MGKTHVHELAKKFGIDDAEILQKLSDLGIDASDTESILSDDDVLKFEAAQTGQEMKIEEQRINPGIIRRRKKAVEKKPEAEEPVAEPEVEEAQAASEESPTDIELDQVVADEPKAEQPSAEEKAEKTDESEAEESQEQKETEAPTKPEKVTKASPNQAKILGRVELPTPAEKKPRRPASPDRKKPSGRPAAAAAAAPGTGPGPGEVPPPEKEGRGKKRKKGKERVDFGPGEKPRRRGRREVFEPDRDFGRNKKNRRQAKPAKKTEITVSKAIKRIIKISDVITVGELAKRMGVKANDLIRELMNQGQMVTINHPLDFETAALLASEFSYEVENIAFDEETILEKSDIATNKEEDSVEDLEERSPVVTIMGHVDHGKTSLLDAVRATSVTEGEAGGITQHIGAYEVEINGRKIAFLDTPGHEAFTAMRSRGAQVTDIVVLVVAADDGVMPQTKEAINHARAAGVPLIVAVNKIDKPDANPDRVKQELADYELVPEDWGGDTIFVEVSAKQQTNLDQLLEMILLQAEVLELKANPNKKAKGTVVEARLDKGRGPVATILVQEGTLKIGDPVVTGVHYGRVRTMVDDLGKTVEKAGPSCPVEVTGLSGVPDAGDNLHAVEDEKTAKDVAQHRQQKLREAEMAQSSKVSLEQLYAQIQQGDVKELKTIIKADVQGSVEAVKDSLNKLSTDNCRLIVIHTAVGGITESDITLASASNAIVLGFNVRPEGKATVLAEKEGVDIRLYNIIYDAVDDIRNAMEGLLAPTFQEKAMGRIEVRETFHVSKVGTIAGCYVLDGKVMRNAKARLVRDSIVIWEGSLNSLKRFKDDVKEVQAGYECGLGLENYNDIKVGDIIEAYEMEEIKSTL
ncbi:MAG: translation initiation factor IF-2 [Desulfuromonas sp.]|nr:MAG: translation initiation factor IF-2 [Desulfuromonas sp.]